MSRKVPQLNSTWHYAEQNNLGAKGATKMFTSLAY